MPGRGVFTARQLNTVDYRRPAGFAGQRVLVVGGGNCGARIAADLALDGHVEVVWVTRSPPRFLADDVDGRALSDVATARRRALEEGRDDTDGTRALGEPRVHLLGYGDRTGPASATLIGVGRPARDAARAIAQLLRG